MNGFDLTGWTFSGNAFASTNFSVNGSGQVVANGIVMAADGNRLLAFPAFGTMHISGWDTDGSSFADFVTIVSGNTPMCNLADSVTKSGQYIYRVGGTDVALADGGTGASLADPNADRFMMWDDSAGQVKFAALADIATEASPAAGDFILVMLAEGGIAKVNWSSLP